MNTFIEEKYLYRRYNRTILKMEMIHRYHCYNCDTNFKSKRIYSDGLKCLECKSRNIQYQYSREGK